MFELVQAGGWLMLPILLCSIIAVAIVTERLWTLRQKKVIPEKLLAPTCMGDVIGVTLLPIKDGERGHTAMGGIVPVQVDVRAIRRKVGLSQAKFATNFGFSIDAVRNWEQGRRQPDVAARAFLIVIDREPDAVRRALSATSE